MRSVNVSGVEAVALQYAVAHLKLATDEWIKLFGFKKGEIDAITINRDRVIVDGTFPAAANLIETISLLEVVQNDVNAKVTIRLGNVDAFSIMEYHLHSVGGKWIVWRARCIQVT